MYICSYIRAGQILFCRFLKRRPISSYEELWFCTRAVLLFEHTFIEFPAVMFYLCLVSSRQRKVPTVYVRFCYNRIKWTDFEIRQIRIQNICRLLIWQIDKNERVDEIQNWVYLIFVALWQIVEELLGVIIYFEHFWKPNQHSKPLQYKWSPISDRHSNIFPNVRRGCFNLLGFVVVVYTFTPYMYAIVPILIHHKIFVNDDVLPRIHLRTPADKQKENCLSSKFKDNIGDLMWLLKWNPLMEFLSEMTFNPFFFFADIILM